MLKFLKKSHIGKLNLLKQLIVNGGKMSTKELSGSLDVSQKTIIRYALELQEELHKLNEDVLHFEQNRQFICLDATKEQVNYHFVDYLNLSYLRESPPFLLLLEMLYNPKSSPTQLAETLHLNKSSIYSYILDLKKHLKKFKIDLDITSDDGARFIGDEKHLRFFYYYFFWNSYKGNLSQFEGAVTHLHEALIVENLDSLFDALVPSKQKRAIFILAICLRQTQERQQFAHMSKEIAAVVRIFSEVNDLATIYDSKEIDIPEEHLENEKFFLNLFFRLGLSGVDTDQQREKIIGKLKETDSEIMILSQKLLIEIQKQFNLNFAPTQQLNYLYNIVLLNLYLFYIDVDMPNEMMKMFGLNDLFRLRTSYGAVQKDQITAFCRRFMKENHISIRYAPIIDVLVFELIKGAVTTQLRIAVQFSLNNLGEYIIKEKLKLIFNHEVLTFVENIDEADLVISDCYEGYQEKMGFYIEDFSDKRIWYNLFQFIQEQITNRLIL